MKFLLTAFLTAALTSCSSMPASSPQLASRAPGVVERDLEKNLREANHRYDVALVAADTFALDALYLPEFTYMGPGGIVRNKTEQIQSLASGTVDVIAGRSDEVTVRIYGDTAILTGRFTGRVRVPGDEFSFHERYSSVWFHHGNVWRLVLEHGTVIKDK
jgi:ketosteroid isomerase-like protein